MTPATGEHRDHEPVVAESAPPITFAIPFFNGLPYLPRAIESVLAQRDTSWRAVVCDNDSPERGADKVVRSFGDDRIRYVRHPDNRGMAGNFNRCLDLAETDLVTLLHADDELAPSYTATMRAAAARHPAAVAFFCRAEIIGPEGRPVFSLPDRVKDFISPFTTDEILLAGEPGIRALLRGNFIMAPTLCFRKSRLGTRGFPEGFHFVLDWELTTRLVLDGDTLVGLADRCYRYRRHGEQTTAHFTRTQNRFREEADYYDRMRALAQRNAWPRCVQVATRRRTLKLNVLYCALQSFARLHLGQARRAVGLLREI